MGGCGELRIYFIYKVNISFQMYLYQGVIAILTQLLVHCGTLKCFINTRFIKSAHVNSSGATYMVRHLCVASLLLNQELINIKHF